MPFGGIGKVRQDTASGAGERGDSGVCRDQRHCPPTPNATPSGRQSCVGFNVLCLAFVLPGLSQRRETIRPADQEKLSEAKLAEEVPRSLMAKDPNLRSGVVCYSFTDSAFKQIPGGGGDDSVVFHFSMDGCKLHIGEALHSRTLVHAPCIVRQHFRPAMPRAGSPLPRLG